MYTRILSNHHRVVTTQGAANLDVHSVGPHPIIRHFLDRMAFSRIVGGCLGTDRESLLNHSQTLSILIQNIILSPAPMYRIAEWAEPIDSKALGISESEKKSLNDDRVARSLDALTSSRSRSLFFRLALHIIKEFELQTQRIHHDTTTVTFHGSYEGSIQEPQIARGINKDHRPDLKQLVFGINVTADGAVPLTHQVLNGNRTDDTIHCNNVDQLRQLLGREEFIYVADSKLCTNKNLRHIDSYGGRFVTVLPRTRHEDKDFRDQLRKNKVSVRWRKSLELPNKRKRDVVDVYWMTSDGPNKTSEGYRIVWCRSSQKMEIDTKSRESNLERAEIALYELNSKLNRGKLRSKTEISKRVKIIQKGFYCEKFLKVRVSSRTQVSIRRLQRGRPRKDAPVKEIRSKMYFLEVQRDKESIRAEARTDGVFPLVTNLEKRGYAKKEVLLIYKYQPYVEKRHNLFKNELGVAPVYLKKPSRAAGLLHATFLAMILDALIERTVREGMIKHRIASIPILPEGRKSKTPTTARLMEMFNGVSWFEFKRGDEVVLFPIKLTDLQKQILLLLGIDSSVYQ